MWSLAWSVQPPSSDAVLSPHFPRLPASAARNDERKPGPTSKQHSQTSPCLASRYPRQASVTMPNAIAKRTESIVESRAEEPIYCSNDLRCHGPRIDASRTRVVMSTFPSLDTLTDWVTDSLLFIQPLTHSSTHLSDSLIHRSIP